MAGFVHETQLLENQHLVRSLIEDQIGQPVGIAAVCGLAVETVMRPEEIWNKAVS